MRDCEPVPGEAVTVTDRGYFVRYIATHTGREAVGTIAFTATKPSRDHMFHACAISSMVICLYEPVGY